MRRRLNNFFKTAKNFFISVTFMKTATENPQWRTPYYSFARLHGTAAQRAYATLCKAIRSANGREAAASMGRVA